jgi:hypothetical protein
VEECEDDDDDDVCENVCEDTPQVCGEGAGLPRLVMREVVLLRVEVVAPGVADHVNRVVEVEVGVVVDWVVAMSYKILGVKEFLLRS